MEGRIPGAEGRIPGVEGRVLAGGLPAECSFEAQEHCSQLAEAEDSQPAVGDSQPAVEGGWFLGGTG